MHATRLAELDTLQAPKAISTADAESCCHTERNVANVTTISEPYNEWTLADSLQTFHARWICHRAIPKPLIRNILSPVFFENRPRPFYSSKLPERTRESSTIRNGSPKRRTSTIPVRIPPAHEPYGDILVSPQVSLRIAQAFARRAAAPGSCAGRITNSGIRPRSSRILSEVSRSRRRLPTPGM